MMEKIKVFFQSSAVIILIAVILLANILLGWSLISGIFSPKSPSSEEIEMWKAEGYEQGYNDGYEEGYSDGLWDAKNNNQ